MNIKTFASGSTDDLDSQVNAFLQTVIFVGLEYAVVQPPNSITIYSVVIVYSSKKL